MATQDILVGSGVLWYAATGTANPDETTVAYGAAWGGTWTSAGDTFGALVLNFNEERITVTTQQRLGPLREFRTAVAPTLRGALAEHTGANLALLTGGTSTPTAAGASQKGYTSVTIGNDKLPVYRKFGFETLRVQNDGTKQPVRYFFHVGTIMPDGDINFDKEGETQLPFTITIHEDTSQAAGSEFMAIEIVTAAATA